ncbi:hypothetical protein V8B97DRAFT_2010263, partial [Scleroderma yunnanense]
MKANEAMSLLLDYSLAFRLAPPEIEHLRNFAQEGRDEMLHMEADEPSSGRRKIVWGLADVHSGSNDNEEQDIRKLAGVPQWRPAGEVTMIQNAKAEGRIGKGPEKVTIKNLKAER